MNSIVLKIALGAAALAISYAGASAQGVGIYVGPGGYYDDPYYTSPGYVERGPRVYGYRRYYSEPLVDDAEIPRLSGGCGTYYFWDGERCVDARLRNSRGY